MSTPSLWFPRGITRGMHANLLIVAWAICANISAAAWTHYEWFVNDRSANASESTNNSRNATCWANKEVNFNFKSNSKRKKRLHLPLSLPSLSLSCWNETQKMKRSKTETAKLVQIICID